MFGIVTPFWAGNCGCGILIWVSVNESKPKRPMCRYYETLKPNLGGLSVVVFTCMLTLHCSETSEVNFGGLDVDFFYDDYLSVYWNLGGAVFSM